jgi:hypothetical protein
MSLLGTRLKLSLQLIILCRLCTAQIALIAAAAVVYEHVQKKANAALLAASLESKDEENLIQGL